MKRKLKVDDVHHRLIVNMSKDLGISRIECTDSIIEMGFMLMVASQRGEVDNGADAMTGIVKLLHKQVEENPAFEKLSKWTYENWKKGLDHPLNEK